MSVWGFLCQNINTFYPKVWGKELQMTCVNTRGVGSWTGSTNGSITGHWQKHKHTHQGNTDSQDSTVCMVIWSERGWKRKRNVSAKCSNTSFLSLHTAFVHKERTCGGRWEKDKCVPVRLPVMGSFIIHSVVSTQPKHLYIIQQNPHPLLYFRKTHFMCTKNTHSLNWLKLRFSHACVHRLVYWLRNLCLQLFSELMSVYSIIIVRRIY